MYCTSSNNTHHAVKIFEVDGMFRNVKNISKTTFLEVIMLKWRSPIKAQKYNCMFIVICCPVRLFSETIFMGMSPKPG